MESITSVGRLTTPAIRCTTSGSRYTTTPATPTTAAPNTPSRLTGTRLRSLADNLWERDEPEATEILNMYNALLDREQRYVKNGLDLFLEYDEMTRLRKREMLHKKWVDRVFEPIQIQLEQNMEKSNNYKLYANRRTKLYEEYLRHVNKKGHVMLDVIAPDEYNALALRDIKPMLLKIKTHRLDDPVSHQRRARNREDEVSIRCQTGCGPLKDADVEAIREPHSPLVPLGRKGIDSIRWLEEPLLSINSKDREASRRRMLGNLTKSRVQLSWGDQVTAAPSPSDELRLQRRRRLPVDNSLPRYNVDKDTVLVSSKPVVFAM